MRRVPLALGLVLAVLPTLAAAQTTTTSGVLTTPVTGDASINQSECGSTTEDITFQWVVSTTVTPFPNTGIYRLFASNRSWTENTTGTATSNFCFETDGTDVRADQIGDDIPVTATSQTEDFLVSDILTASGYDACDATSNKTIYICAHWYDSSGNRNGWAHGQVTLSLVRPGAPTNVRVASGDRALRVDWTGSTSTDVDHYYAVATSSLDAAVTKRSDDVSEGTRSVRIDGLENEVEYLVHVFAVSEADNVSEGSPEARGTPHPSEDFWDYYKHEGPEEGGCASGAAGALAILGVASLLVLRRRKS
jgi:hypothetical protein